MTRIKSCKQDKCNVRVSSWRWAVCGCWSLFTNLVYGNNSYCVQMQGTSARDRLQCQHKANKRPPLTLRQCSSIQYSGYI